MGLLHSHQHGSPETVSYHRRRGACATGSDSNGSVIVDTLLPGNAPANDVIVAVAAPPAQVSGLLIVRMRRKRAFRLH